MNAHKKKYWRKAAIIPQAILFSVWLIPMTKSSSAIKRHTHKLQCIVVRSFYKREEEEKKKLNNINRDEQRINNNGRLF